MSEHVDAARAIEVIDLGDRALVRSSLAATLVKDGDHLPAFYSAFDVFFSTRSVEAALEALEGSEADEEMPRAPRARRGAGRAGEGGGATSSLSAQELFDLIYRALRDGDARRRCAARRARR